MTFRLSLIAILLASLAAGAGAAEKIPAARRLPGNTIAFVSIRNIPEAKDKWSLTHWGQLIQDASLAQFRAAMLKRTLPAAGEIEKQLGIPLADLLGIPQGEFSAAYIGTGKARGGIGILEVGEKTESVTKLLDKAARTLEDKGYRRTEEDIGGALLVSYPVSEADGDQEPGSTDKGLVKAVAWCLKDESLVIGTSTETVKAALNLWDGTSDLSLAENSSFQQIEGQCRREGEEAPALTFYLNPRGITLAAMGADNPLAAGFVDATMQQYGFDHLGGAGGAVFLASGEHDILLRMFVGIEPDARGVFDLLQFPETDLTPPVWINQNATSYMALNWDTERAFAGVEKLYDKIAGKGKFAEMIEAQARNPESARLHAKKDFVDFLSGRVLLISYPRQGEATAGSPLVAAIGLKDAAGFERTFARLTAHEGFPLEARDFKGQKIHELKDEDGGVSVAVALAHQQILIATDVAALEDVLRGGGGDPLADLPDFRKMAAKSPERLSILSFQRQDKELEPLYQLLKSGVLDDLAGNEEETFDFTTLPEFEAIRKHLGPAVTYLKVLDGGWLIESFTLK